MWPQLELPVTWYRSPVVPLESGVLSVFASVQCGSGVSVGTQHKQRWVGCFPIAVRVPVDVGPLCYAAGLAGRGLVTRLLVMVGDVGSYSFAAGWMLSS